MREKLVKICLERLAVTNSCIEDYEAYYQQSEFDMFSPVPTSSAECESVGNLIKDLGEALEDFELIGLGQTFVDKSNLLLLEESKARR